MKAVTDFKIDGDALIVEGVRISLVLLPQVLYELTHPDPRKWYRFERIEDRLVVHVRITESIEPLSHPIATVGE
jgi:hypothetical protein